MRLAAQGGYAARLIDTAYTACDPASSRVCVVQGEGGRGHGRGSDEVFTLMALQVSTQETFKHGRQTLRDSTHDNELSRKTREIYLILGGELTENKLFETDV